MWIDRVLDSYFYMQVFYAYVDQNTLLMDPGRNPYSTPLCPADGLCTASKKVWILKWKYTEVYYPTRSSCINKLWYIDVFKISHAYMMFVRVEGTVIKPTNTNSQFVPPFIRFLVFPVLWKCHITYPCSFGFLFILWYPTTQQCFPPII